MPDESGVRTQDEWDAVKHLLVEYVIRQVVTNSVDEREQAISNFIGAMPEYPNLFFRMSEEFSDDLRECFRKVREHIAQIPPPNLFTDIPIEKIHLLIREMMEGYWHRTQMTSALRWYAMKYGLIFETEERKKVVEAARETSAFISSLAENMDVTGITFEIAGSEVPEIELDKTEEVCYV